MAMTKQPVVAAFRVPAVGSWLLTVTSRAQAHALGRTAVAVPVRTAPIPGSASGSAITSKINFMGCTNAMGEGTATPIAGLRSASAPRGDQFQLQVSGAKGGYARGIPPRGRPV
jgi:uncharacterized protein (DUF697 family)